MKTGTSRASARRKSVCIVSSSGSRGHSGSAELDQRGAEMLAENRFDLARRRGDDRHLGQRAGRDQHRLADDAEPDAGERAARARRRDMARIGRGEHRGARHRRERVARIVIAFDRVLQRVEHLGAIRDRAAMDPAAIAVDVRADRAAVEAEHRLVRQDQRNRVVIGRTAARGARLLAETGHHEIDADRQRRARARSERGGARGVVGVCGIAGPGAALVAERRGENLVGLVAPARIAGTAIVFGVDRLGENDRTLAAQLFDQDVIARREVDVVGRVAAAGGTHVGGVERVLEREHDAVHRHRLEIGIASVGGVELGRALQRIGLMAEESRTPAAHRAAAAPATDDGRNRRGR